MTFQRSDYNLTPKSLGPRNTRMTRKNFRVLRGHMLECDDANLETGAFFKVQNAEANVKGGDGCLKGRQNYLGQDD